MKNQKAFTLIELLAVIALLSILLIVAGPSFRDFHRSSQLATQVNNLIASLHTAKNEAIKHNTHSYVVPTDGTSWKNGWSIFIDTDFDGTFTQGTDIKILDIDPLPSTLEVVANGSAAGASPHLSFDGSGYPRFTGAVSNLTISMHITGLSSAEKIKNTRNIKLSKTGRIRSCKPATDNSCTTPASNS